MARAGQTVCTLDSTRHAVRAALVAAALTLPAVPTLGLASTAFELNIPAEDLGSALKDLGAAAHEQLLFSDTVVAGYRSPQLSGRFTLDDALKILLQGANLKIDRTKSGVILVRRTAFLINQNEDSAPGRSVAATATDAAPTAPPADDRAPAANTAPALGEVVVTATRRAEDISKVPISITAITQTSIDTLGIKDLSDMAKYTPGIVVDSDRTNQIAIRGISASGGADTTGIYIDDTPIQTRTSVDALPEAFDIERVEVLRGPQGTLFGAGAEGGAVRYILTPPSVTQSSIYSRDEVSYTWGGAPNYEIGVAGGTPIIDHVLGFRATADITHQGGWIDRVNDINPGPGGPDASVIEHNANRNTKKLFRVALLWEPSSNWQITPGLYYQERSQDSPTIYWPLLSNPSADQYASGYPDHVPYDDHFLLSSLRIQGNLGFADLISNTAYFFRYTHGASSSYQGTTYNLSFYQNLIGKAADGSFLPGFPLIDGTGIHLPPALSDYRAFSGQFSWFKNWTQELRLQSADPSARLLWTVGAYFGLYSQNTLSEIYGQYDTRFFNYFGTSVFDVFGAPLLNAPTANGVIPLSWFNPSTNLDRNVAAFADATYSFTEQWKLNLGVRETQIGYDFSNLYAASQQFGPTLVTGGEVKQRSFTPKANLTFQIDPSDMLYATWARGFRDGGANPAITFQACSADFTNDGITGTPPSYASDTTESYEIGTKNNIANRVQIAGSAYYINWNNIQQRISLPICGLGFVDNLGAATAKGVDFQGLFRLTDALTLNLSAGYTEARFTQSVKLSPTVKRYIVADGDAIQDANGNPTPPFTGTIGLDYRFNAGAREAFIHADDSYTSAPKWIGPGEDRATSQYQAYNFLLPSRNQVNLRTGVFVGLWEIDAFVNNLTDAHPLLYYAFTSNPHNGASSLEFADTLMPRTVGLSFIFRK